MNKFKGLIKLREGCGKCIEEYVRRNVIYNVNCGVIDGKYSEAQYCPECQRAIETAESIEKEVYSLESHSIDVRDKPYLRKKIGNDNILIADFIYWKDLNKLKEFIQKGEE